MTRLLVLLILIAAQMAAQATTAPAIDVPSWVRVEANISYAEHVETVLDILQPGTASMTERPGVIVIHGGGWVGGEKERMVQNHCIPYLEKGFVVCNVEYRLAKAAPAPAAVNDVLEAAKWFRENAKEYNVDKKRIVVTGTSAGGHLALMVGLAGGGRLGPRTDIAAVVNWYGITDVAELLGGERRRDWAVTWMPEQEDRLQLARLVSPIAYLHGSAPPVLTIHGDTDDVVPYAQGVKLTRSLRDEGADAELISVRDGGHGGFGEGRMKELYESIFKFLRKRDIIR